jgi:CRISPR-associated protein Csb1
MRAGHALIYGRATAFFQGGFMDSNELFQLVSRASSGGLVALRAITKLQPVDGEGGKVAPPTYEGGAYAFERRVRDGRVVETVLIDSVQSQANRFEEVLLEACRVGRLRMPLLEIDIPGYGGITSLTAPHRVHDAIFRDSIWDGRLFRESENGRRIIAARPWNATPLFEFAPTVLLFGTWDSQGGGGVNTAKIARSLVSEIVAFEAVRGVRTSSRIDPLGIKLVRDVVVKLEGAPEVWRFQEPTSDSKQSKDSQKAKGLKTVRPSEVNHGNITPSITGPDGPGGVTFAYAEQTTVLSFTQLRRLRFPDAQAQTTPERDIAGRAVIAALGIYAVVLQWENGFQLRSRCQLVPVEAAQFEVIGRAADERKKVDIDVTCAEEALAAAIEQASDRGLRWHEQAVRLQPREDLLRLVDFSNRSVEIAEEQ